MKIILLLLGFVVFWKQWDIVERYNFNGTTREEAGKVEKAQPFDSLEGARDFVSRHKKDERYTDMHIYKIGEEIQP